LMAWGNVSAPSRLAMIAGVVLLVLPFEQR